MLSIFIVFFLICALNVNRNVLAECVKDLPTNCNCSNIMEYKYYSDSTDCLAIAGHRVYSNSTVYSCKDEKNKTINLKVSQYWDVEIACEKGVSKEWYNSLNNIKVEIVNNDIDLRVISCLIPEESILEFLVKRVGLSIKGKIKTLYFSFMNNLNNSDPSFWANLFADLTELEDISFEDTNLQHVPSNIFQPYRRQIRTINLPKNNLSRVNIDSFNGLTTLRRLDLSKNNLSQLEDGTFSKLYSLEVLYLKGNHLNQLSRDIFKDLKELQTLTLQNNNLATLTRKTFSPLSSLLNLNLESNGITTLDADIFDDLRKLQCLDMSNNNISSTILPKLISNIPHLLSISLDGNGITQLAEDTFHKSQYLLNVNLKNNSLTELPDTLFQKCVYLDQINLSYNKLNTLKEKQFEKLEKLLELNLDNNELTSIPANIFKDLENLYLLTLNNNRLTALPDALFQGVKYSLGMISLHNNPWECNCVGNYLLSFLKNSGKYNFKMETNMITCAKNGLPVIEVICPEIQDKSG